MNYHCIIRFFTTLISIFRIFSKRLKKAAISAFSGQTAFFLMLSFFPFVMFLFSLLKYTPFTEDMLLEVTQIFLPTSFRSFIGSLVNEIYENQSSTLLPITVVSAIWLGSKAFLSLIQGLNSIFELSETRNYIMIRIYSVFYTIAFAILILATLMILVFGNAIYYFICKYIPILNDIFLSIISLRPVLALGIMFVFFTLMYKILPNNHNTFTSQMPGALIATAGWMGFSYLYSYYVDHISNYATFYGTMTIIALLMIWLYACMYILFLGGMINYLLEHEHFDDYIKLFRNEP